MILENSIVFSRQIYYPEAIANASLPATPVSLPSEYLIYDSSGNFGRVVTILITINNIYADTIFVDFQFADSTTVTKSFDNTVDE